MEPIPVLHAAEFPWRANDARGDARFGQAACGILDPLLAGGGVVVADQDGKAAVSLGEERIDRLREDLARIARRNEDFDHGGVLPRQRWRRSFSVRLASRAKKRFRFAIGTGIWLKLACDV